MTKIRAEIEVPNGEYCESARAERHLEQKGAIYAHKKIYKKR